MAKEHLGFIGVGRMGGPMASRLLDDGFSLTICDTSDAAAAPLVARGARRAASPAEVASTVEAVMVSLPTPSVVQAVALGENGVIGGSRVKTFIDLSTTGPRVASAVAAGLAAKNIVAVDSPVSGGVSGAKIGTLALMVACPREMFERMQTILRPIGKPFFIGDRPGMGQTMKLVNNLLSAAA
ncbi:MAG TPA: NAD(P)-dependent oxidoreductase, partial [Candidatus Binataceae bacterium]|nr:NAD(P)-dependent oxidoreductase [Candidatus Binataceae bacterium]